VKKREFSFNATDWGRLRIDRQSEDADGTVGKTRGVLHPRVQQIGPEHFGIVCFDCAKARSRFLLADFYGRVLIPPTVVDTTGRHWRRRLTPRRSPAADFSPNGARCDSPGQRPGKKQPVI